jgi:ribosomal protein L7Ae-like RNA K-turn-binding protein
MTRALSLLGMARRAGCLLIGQDRVLGAKGDLFILTAEDCSPSVLRKVAPRLVKGVSVCLNMRGVTRETLGRSVGVNGAQIAALPIGSGFIKNLAELLQ